MHTNKQTHTHTHTQSATAGCRYLFSGAMTSCLSGLGVPCNRSSPTLTHRYTQKHSPTLSHRYTQKMLTNTHTQVHTKNTHRHFYRFTQKHSPTLPHRYTQKPTNTFTQVHTKKHSLTLSHRYTQKTSQILSHRYK